MAIQGFRCHDNFFHLCLDKGDIIASRCFDEIEYLNVNILDTKGRSRAITIPPDVKQLWEQIQHILRDPVIRRYAFPDDIHLEKKTRRGEEIGCVVLELGYFIDYGQKSIQDPLSVALSLTDEEKQDERVMISINEMLEEYVW